MYFKTDEKILTTKDFVQKNISSQYDKGYLFGRIENGYMYQTRALRIDLSKFSLNSENRRILKKFLKEKPYPKTSEINYFDLDNYKTNLLLRDLPIISDKYDWRIHKIGKDFYETKFPESKFSANKIKEVLTREFHFNLIIIYKDHNSENPIGYTICYHNNDFLHYCYPFYNLEKDHNNLGMFMMLSAIIWSKNQDKKHVYLGGVTRPKDKYKLQFEGLEWWDSGDEAWKKDLSTLKSLL